MTEAAPAVTPREQTRAVRKMADAQIRDRILAVLEESGLEREEALAHQKLAAVIDSLQLLELTGEIEDCLHMTIPDDELNEENFASVAALMRMVGRISEGAV